MALWLWHTMKSAYHARPDGTFAMAYHNICLPCKAYGTFVVGCYDNVLTT